MTARRTKPENPSPVSPEDTEAISGEPQKLPFADVLATLPRREMGKLKGYRTSMHDVYKLISKGLLPNQEGKRLVEILNIMRKARLEEDQLELLKKGGIVGVPFAGLTVVVAAVPEQDEPKTLEHQAVKSNGKEPAR